MLKNNFHTVLFGCFLLLTACSQPPLQKLQGNTVYADMNLSYWANEQEQTTTLWTQAVSYCKRHYAKPNCPAVIQVYIISNGITTAPAIGHSGHSLDLPRLTKP